MTKGTKEEKELPVFMVATATLILSDYDDESCYAKLITDPELPDGYQLDTTQPCIIAAARILQALGVSEKEQEEGAVEFARRLN